MHILTYVPTLVWYRAFYLAFLSEIFAGTAFGSSKAATRSGTADINLQTLTWFLKGIGLVETGNEFCVFYDFHDPLKVLKLT